MAEYYSRYFNGMSDDDSEEARAGGRNIWRCKVVRLVRDWLPSPWSWSGWIFRQVTLLWWPRTILVANYSQFLEDGLLH